jgi:hypothetical protein
MRQLHRRSLLFGSSAFLATALLLGAPAASRAGGQDGSFGQGLMTAIDQVMNLILQANGQGRRVHGLDVALEALVDAFTGQGHHHGHHHHHHHHGFAAGMEQIGLGNCQGGKGGCAGGAAARLGCCCFGQAQEAGQQGPAGAQPGAAAQLAGNAKRAAQGAAKPPVANKGDAAAHKAPAKQGAAAQMGRDAKQAAQGAAKRPVANKSDAPAQKQGAAARVGGQAQLAKAHGGHQHGKHGAGKPQAAMANVAAKGVAKAKGDQGAMAPIAKPVHGVALAHLAHGAKAVASLGKAGKKK